MLINFRLAHVKEMFKVATKEDILKESQVRETEHLEVHLTKDTFREACEGLEAWKADMPEVANDYEAVAGTEAQTVGFALLAVFLLNSMFPVTEILPS